MFKPTAINCSWTFVTVSQCIFAIMFSFVRLLSWLLQFSCHAESYNEAFRVDILIKWTMKWHCVIDYLFGIVLTCVVVICFQLHIHYLLGKGDLGLCFRQHFFVCLAVSSIAQNVMNRLWWNFMVESGMVKGTSDQILVVVWIIMLTAQLEIKPLLKKLWTDVDDFFRIARNDKTNTWSNFGGDLDHHADSPNLESGQYGVMSCLGQGDLCSLSALFITYTNVVEGG